MEILKNKTQIYVITLVSIVLVLFFIAYQTGHISENMNCEDGNYNQSDLDVINIMKKNIDNYAGIPEDKNYLNSLEEFMKPDLYYSKNNTSKFWIVSHDIYNKKHDVSFIYRKSGEKETIIECAIACNKLMENCKIQR